MIQRDSIQTQNRLNSRRERPPKAPGLPVIGNLIEFGRDRLGAAQSYTYDYDDLVEINMLFKRAIVLNNPNAIKHVLQDNNRNYAKIQKKRIQGIFGNGLLLNNGTSWLHQRRLIQPAFHRRQLHAFGNVFANATQAMMGQWAEAAQRGTPLDMLAEMTQLTLTCASNTLFGLDLHEEATTVGDAFHTISQSMQMNNLLSILLPWLPTESNRRYNKALAALHRVTGEIIQQRRVALADVDPGDEMGTLGDNLLTMLMLARDEESGEGMSDQQLHDEILTMLLAGHETTSTTLCWALYLLAEHPSVMKTLQDELKTALADLPQVGTVQAGKRQAGKLPTVDILPKLPYTKMVIQETMRLYPAAWAISRVAIEDDEICGYRIPAGTGVMASIYAMQRHPDYWTEPDAFRPERFAPEQAGDYSKFVYFPFGGGPRICIGNHFAMMEAQIILATIAQHYTFTVVPGHKVEPEPAMTVRPKGGLPMHIGRHLNSL